jgi:hypothetical protein
MPSHFDNIGLGVTDDFGRMITTLAARGESELGERGSRLLWSDPSGARLAAFVDDTGAIQCAKPSFAGRSTVLARGASETPEPEGCPFCAVTTVEVLEGGELAYPLALEREDAHRVLPMAGDSTPIVVCAFAQDISTWVDEDDYTASQDPAEPGFAPRSLIPSGLFSFSGEPEPPQAMAIVTGVVARGGRRTNSYTGASFDWCELDTYAATVDVVAAPQPEPFAPGQVVQGDFWLIAYPAVPPTREES